jgi:enoyl-[acyl-carrier protein] reductase II
MQQGELEIGQIAATIPTILPAAQIVNQVWSEFLTTIEQLHFSTSSHY